MELHQLVSYHGERPAVPSLRSFGAGNGYDMRFDLACDFSVAVLLLPAMEGAFHAFLHETLGDAANGMLIAVVRLLDLLDRPWFFVEGFVQFHKDLGMADFLCGSLPFAGNVQKLLAFVFGSCHMIFPWSHFPHLGYIIPYSFIVIPSFLYH